MGIFDRLKRGPQAPDAEKLRYLRRYHKDVEIVSGGSGRHDIPDAWREILQSRDRQARVGKLLSVWEKYAGVSLRKTIAFLSEHLRNVELISYRGRYALLYTIQNAAGEVLYYEGGAPALPHGPLKELWDRVPASIRVFYEQVHNGFFEYAGGSMGLAGLDEVMCLAEEEWGVVEDLSLEPPYEFERSFAFFATGAGGYCVIDTAKQDSERDAFLWFSASRPRYHVDFWDVVDEWIVIGAGR